jgi:hypothetical protein
MTHLAAERAPRVTAEIEGVIPLPFDETELRPVWVDVVE